MTDHIDDAIAVLNRIHETDPTVLPKLIFYRVPCNEALSDDPTVQVGRSDKEDADWEVGLLGIINGLFGIQEDGFGYIVAQFEEGSILRFSRHTVATDD